MSVAFSSNDADVIHRNVEINLKSKKPTALDHLNTVYEIQRSAEWIKKNKFKKVALQFPDDLLLDSTNVAKCLEIETGERVFILGDTSYGSCCVDEVAAQHYSADSVIHYGRACLSPVTRYPVLYVFGRKDIDVQHCCEQFQKLFPDLTQHVLVLYDVVYSHAIGDLKSRLQGSYCNVLISELNTTEKTGEGVSNVQANSNTQELFGRTVIIPIEKTIKDYKVFYIGAESFALTNFIMTLNQCTFYSYNPETSIDREESLSVNRAIMKRYYMIEKAKDAKIVGIVAGTLGIADYLTVISRLKEITKKAGKKTYTFVMGKLNPAKMANFMEIDVFVLVACPENSLLDSSEFYKPIVTPFEMEIACNQAREWTGEYITDFRKLLPGSTHFVEMSEASQQQEVSLLTGAMRSIGTDDTADDSEASSTAVMKRDDALTVANASTAGDFLASRSWQGLEQNLGQTPVTKAVEGIKGIASGYTHEQKTEKQLNEKLDLDF
ncbi:2-(3-amino-3-carboxypropyl)histidine synthase subunit 2-like [Lingula anatina]|uniref:2-(3-amino-3-carboxypropyl)histidine synthase subunit 2 n=1 Tax=Lingula anatina TaxID=7574 RepID=A0A1S3J669_LINAN|nr:2-(3-amino-3-carboxypropyl)histidine synthase subunit 2-like [Lingula anatina]|eukprot:XP_013405912.1 2-(3-amino-3-carboxypropyl)histidine synthase subunit 2-like [Lingula anatina]